MGLWNGKERVAIGFGPDRLRLLVARRNGDLEAVHGGSAPAPAGAISCGLRAPALVHPEALGATLRELLEEARAAGHLSGKPELVAAVIPDASVKLATTALAGAAPPKAEGERMARWSLRELLPMPAAEIRTSWSVVEVPGSPEPERWFVSLGAAEAVVAEYEKLVQSLGWSIGRVIPWALAAAGEEPAPERQSSKRRQKAPEGEAARFTDRLVLCEGDGAMACLFESSGVPRLHRTWRARVAADRIDHELPSVQRYVMDHLEMAVDEIRVCGSPDWTDTAAEAAAGSGLRPAATTPEMALLGALRG